MKYVAIIGALWNLTFMPDFAPRVIDSKGIQALICLSLVSGFAPRVIDSKGIQALICLSLVSGSQLARFLAVLAMANILHVIPEECKHKRRTSSNQLPNILMSQMRHIEEFIDKLLNNKKNKKSDSDQIRELARIEDIHQMECRSLME